jgi:hypothetical protein
MQLVTIDKYIHAVITLLQERGGQTPPLTTPVTIYLATEDEVAAHAFIHAAPQHWTIVTDVAVEELTPFRPPSSVINCASVMAKHTRGRGGLISMGSLLVSMEANDFVLSTGSTFGRVMNEIRTRILDPRCGNCTRLIDVQPGVWE